MHAQARPPRQGHYGFDAPYAVIGMGLGGIICVLMAAGWATSPVPLVYGPLWLGLYGLALLGMAGSFTYTTRRGKFEVWTELIDALHLDGDEQVLDMGCGRGLVLLEVARHLDSGKAVGIDLWRSLDQSGNDEVVTQANARAEGVADRVELHTGDMSALPFGDASFDLVVSSLALHNIRKVPDREKAIDQAVRVLRPGGRLLIADFRHTDSYAERLREQGMTDVTRRNLGWRFWYGGPPWATHLVSATKPL
ncbi:MAG TPA: class I SAM-dependent methyltransferase [Oleiagrimonas sp.]|nr:class I SAM-dependent methyltransferase [Oleiagrimonas sp.]